MRPNFVTLFLLSFISLSFSTEISKTFSDSTINSDTTFEYKEKFNWIEQIAPITFLVSGIALNAGNAKYNLQAKTPNTSTKFDDFTQYAPMLELYISNIFLTEHQNSVWDETKYLFISQMLSSVLAVQTLKRITHIQRPNSTNYHSFPSGHTSTAFVGATVLYHEYKKNSPLLAYSGFIFATATAVLRVTNNKHWIPDVVTSAGLSMIITNLVYHFKPFKSSKMKKRKKLRAEKKMSKNLTISPTGSFSGKNWKLGFTGKF